MPCKWELPEGYWPLIEILPDALRWPALNDGTISQSYSNLAGGGDPDGGVAFVHYGTIASNVFWNTGAVGSALANGVSSPAVGLTGAQLSQASSFGPTWDFSATGAWALPAGAGAPVLRWQLSQQ